ncbi:MAG: nuclear transport factor 2 family protein [candidate division WOR-3 bacterium]|nr:MAG: nuclear transport factor 2 family protein [candidate division WOR-3 bacterium]
MKHQALVLEFVDRINRQDEHALRRLMHPDFAFIDCEGDACRWADRMRDGFRVYFDAYPDYLIHVDKLVNSGEDGVLVIGRTTGSHIKPETEVRETVVWKADIRDGLVCERRIYADTDAVE